MKDASTHSPKLKTQNTQAFHGTLGTWQAKIQNTNGFFNEQCNSTCFTLNKISIRQNPQGRKGTQHKFS
jgi:hypothetical protein